MNHDRINGKIDEVIGNAKSATGTITGNPGLRIQGAVQHAKGKVETAWGKAKEETGKARENVEATLATQRKKASEYFTAGVRKHD